MAKRSIDMLPLLDVFMVVLFVFATIQEEQLDSSVSERDDLTEALAKQEDQTADANTKAVELAIALERKTKELDQVREELSTYLGINPDAEVQAAVAKLHERLLDNVAVFEVEVHGDLDRLTGVTRNLCCYRADPPAGSWEACGEVPRDSASQLAWLADGGQGLVEGLERTRGGNAIVLLRQSELASYRMSNDLAELLRDRFVDYRVYDDGAVSGSVRCSLAE